MNDLRRVFQERADVLTGQAESGRGVPPDRGRRRLASLIASPRSC
jgi:hypothetical protein